MVRHILALEGKKWYAQCVKGFECHCADSVKPQRFDLGFCSVLGFSFWFGFWFY